MRDHNACFSGKIGKIIPKLFLLPFLIWSTEFPFFLILNTFIFFHSVPEFFYASSKSLSSVSIVVAQNFNSAD